MGFVSSAVACGPQQMAMIEYCESSLTAKGTADTGIELIPGRLQWEAVAWATGQIAI